MAALSTTHQRVQDPLRRAGVLDGVYPQLPLFS